MGRRNKSDDDFAGGTTVPQNLVILAPVARTHARDPRMVCMGRRNKSDDDGGREGRVADLTMTVGGVRRRDFAGRPAVPPKRSSSSRSSRGPMHAGVAGMRSGDEKRARPVGGGRAEDFAGRTTDPKKLRHPRARREDPCTQALQACRRPTRGAPARRAIIFMQPPSEPGEGGVSGSSGQARG